MVTRNVIFTTSSYRFCVLFWTVEYPTPQPPIRVNEPNPAAAVPLRPDNAECFAFTQQRVREEIVQLQPGRQFREFSTDDIEQLPGKHYIDGTVYDAKGLRKFSNAKELVLMMHFSGASRMVRTRYGNFMPFYDSDSVVKL